MQNDKFNAAKDQKANTMERDQDARLQAGLGKQDKDQAERVNSKLNREEARDMPEKVSGDLSRKERDDIERERLRENIDNWDSEKQTTAQAGDLNRDQGYQASNANQAKGANQKTGADQSGSSNVKASAKQDSEAMGRDRGVNDNRNQRS